MNEPFHTDFRIKGQNVLIPFIIEENWHRLVSLMIIYLHSLCMYYVLALISVAIWSKAWVCGHLLAGTLGSNPAGRKYVCLLWGMWVVRYRSLHWADHLSRGVLPSVVCLTVIIRTPW
jgi:hypothetical protein